MPELSDAVDLESHLIGRAISIEAQGGESWVTDPRGLWSSTPPHYRLMHGGVLVTPYRNASSRPLDDEVERRSFLSLFAAALDRFRPHVLINYGGDLPGHEMRSLAGARGATVVFALHNFSYPDAHPFATAHSIIVPSRYAADYYRSALGLDCTVLPNLVPVDRVRAGYSDPRYVAFVNPSYEKGVYAFAWIADEIGRRRPDIPLLVVEGRGSERTLADCGLDLKRNGNVFLMGHTPDPRQFWGVTRLCVVPSLWQESQCLVAIEAMINGIPVLAGDRGALPETLGGAGVLLPLPEWMTPFTRELPSPEEVAPWVDAIVRAWDDPAWSDELRRRSLAAVHRWSPDVLQARHVEFFAHVGRPSKGRGPGGG